MTREEILAMEPGRELDELIMLHVFNMKKVSEGGSFVWALVIDGDIEDWYPNFTHPSTDISAAWEVVEKFDLNAFHLNWLNAENSYGEGWHCKLGEAHAFGCKSAPEAICKAALLAVLGEEE